jgi:hypothetical protein
MSAGGVDGSSLPAHGTPVRELFRLLPTIMQPAHREAAYIVATRQPGATEAPGEDDLGRAATVVTIPLELDGGSTGRLNASVWFDPEARR